MELFIIIIASLFMLIGFMGAIIPIIPGPIISYIGLLLIYFFTELSFSMNEILLYTILTIIVFFSDYLLQFIGVKKFGGNSLVHCLVFGNIIQKHYSSETDSH